MNVIKTVGSPQKTHVDAEELLSKTFTTKNVLFGYVDGENRVVTFETDFSPESSLAPGQERLILTFREGKTELSEKDKKFFSDLGDAMMGRGPLSR